LATTMLNTRSNPIPILQPPRGVRNLFVRLRLFRETHELLPRVPEETCYRSKALPPRRSRATSWRSSRRRAYSGRSCGCCRCGDCRLSTRRTLTLGAIEDFHRIYRRATGVVTARQPDAIGAIRIGREIAPSRDERLPC